MNRPDLKQYLSWYYTDVLEISALMNTEETLFNELFDYMGRMKQNQYIPTADLSGLESFEKMLGIIADATSENIDFRRARLISRLAVNAPYTISELRRRLLLLLGDHFTIIEDTNGYSISIQVTSGNYAQLNELNKMISSMVPANLQSDAYGLVTAESSGTLSIGAILNAGTIVTIPTG